MSQDTTDVVVERKRLDEAREQGIPWKKWGPYVSERQWGTGREDYQSRRERLGLLPDGDGVRLKVRSMVGLLPLCASTVFDGDIVTRHPKLAESDSGMFGGNSNWRGPVWMPVNALIVRALINLYGFYGNDFKVQCPTRTGPYLTLYEVTREIVRRLSSTFLRDGEGKRFVYGGTGKFHDDPHWRNLILFYEYFPGDNGAGIGASHQTGWTGLIAPLLDMFARTDAH
jgi:hypothetical protein